MPHVFMQYYIFVMRPCKHCRNMPLYYKNRILTNKKREMKKLFTSVLMSGLVVLASSCGSSKGLNSLSAIGGEWDVVEINGSSVEPVEDQASPFIGFDVQEKHVYGSAGCNRFSGGFNAGAKKGTISFGAMACTRMMCKDMKTEDMLLEAFGKITNYKLDGNGSMMLGNASSKSMVLLKKRVK